MKQTQSINSKQLEKLSRLGCSFATDYKYRDLSEIDQAKRFINYSFTVKQVLDFWHENLERMKNEVENQ